MTRALIAITVVIGLVRLVVALPGALSSAWAEYETHRAAVAQEWFAEAWATNRPRGQIARIRYVHDPRDELLAIAEPFWLRR